MDLKVYSMRQRLLATSVICGAMAAMVSADTAAAQDGGDSAVEEIVVTGSRIRRDTFTAPQSLTVVSAEAIRESGNTSIGDLLLDQPNINPSTNSQNSSGTLFLAGQTRADIRGLGASRTLVLMDGRRLPFSDASSPAVDLNTIPSLMVERIETIAGGASAVYGSEAISGVVNFIMKKKQDGLEVDLQTGISQEGDGEELRFGFNYGTKFLGDKLNVLIGGEYATQDKVMQRDRDWAYPGLRRDTTQTPQTIIPNSRTNQSPFGVFLLGPGRAVALDIRNPTNVVRLSPGCSSATVAPNCQDEALGYNTVYTAFQGKSNRAVLRSYVDYAFNDDWNAFVDASYVKAGGYGYFSPAFANALGSGFISLVMRGDNAYLNGAGATAAALRSEWTAAGKTFTQNSTAQVAKQFEEFNGRDVKTEREQYRLATGFNGKFQTFGRDVNIDGYVQYSELTGSTISYNTPNNGRVLQATDAVMLNGQVVCRDAAARAAGCVPWDLVNGPSRDAILWTNSNSVTDQRVTQTVGGINFATSLFDLPAGPVGVAFGGEYRKETSSFVQDAPAAAGLLFINPIGTRAGEYSVKDAYAEVRIPILKDLPFAEELSVEIAGRVSEYSTIGGVDQYRLHAEWAPVKDVRFRATQSTAVRAPNIVELYSPQSRNFTTNAVDPCDKDVFRVATAAQQAARRVTCAAAIPGWNPATFVSNFGVGRSSLAILQGGNPDLGAETAHTYEYGVVIQPRWIPGLQVSADFFKYNLTDVVSTLPLTTLFQQLCHDSAQAYASNPFCAQIQRDPTGTNGAGSVGGVIQVVTLNQNLASIKVEGWDYSVAYGFNTEDLFGKDYGSIAMRVDATWMYRFSIQGLPGQAYQQFANQVSNATPEWKGNASVRWAYDRYSLGWSTAWIGSAISTNAFTSTAITRYKTGDYFRHDFRATYRFNDDLMLRAGVINVFDRHPPAIPDNSIYTATATGSSQYDNRGRYFFLGAGMTF